MAIHEIYSNKNAIRVCGNNTYYKKFFIADSLADVAFMNTHGNGFLRHPAGTAVLCFENSTVYVLTRDDNPYGEVNDEENAEFIPMSGGSVTPEDVTEAIETALADYYDRDEIDEIVATKQNVLTAGEGITIDGDVISSDGTTYTAGTGIGITDDEIRVTYGEDSYDDAPAFNGTMEQHDYTGFGTIYWGYAANDGDDPLTEDDYLKIVADASGEGLTFVDFANGDAYQQAVVTLIGMLPSNPPATMQYGIGVNCHGIYVAEDLSSVYLVSDASGTEQTEPAFVLGLATINGEPVIAILSNTNYVESGTYTVTKGTPPLKIPDSAYDFGAVAVGDERPVNGDTVKAAINGAGNGITLTMDAAKNLTVSLKDALGQTIEDDTVNLPLESMVVGGRYADGVLYLTIIDQEEELEIPIADIVSGLVPDSRTVAGIPLSSNITAAALAAIIGGELTHVNANWNDTNPDSAAYIANKPNIPSNANWNDKYTKPSGGIPASDIASGVIPTDVSDLNNDLNYATESFVNSSIATNTAFFRGTFESVSDLPSTNVSNNDYAFVISTTSGGDPEYDRYKYVVSGGSGSWQKEYTLNNSSFTAAQWSAIQSGITAQLVSKISGIPQNIVTGANGGSAIQIVVSSTAPASGTAGNILTLVTG